MISSQTSITAKSDTPLSSTKNIQEQKFNISRKIISTKNQFTGPQKLMKK